MTSPIPSEPRTPRQLYHAAPSLAVAVWITAAAVVTIYAVQGAVAQVAPQLVAVACAYIAVITVVVVMARAIGFELGLRRVPIRFVVAGVLVGLTAWYADLRLVVWLEPGGNPEKLEKLVERAALVPSLAALAALPAIGEELVFRGVLARGIAKRSVVAGVLVSAVVFSAYHVMPAQMLATFPLGLALGVLAIQSRSIVPSMIAHFLNNAIVILLSRDQLPGVDRTIGAHPELALVGAIVLALGGVALAAKGVPA